MQSLDRAWLGRGSGVLVWVDLAAPSIPESLILSDSFSFHPLSVEDAMAALHYPKVEAYDGYLYVVMHGLDVRGGKRGVLTHDIDFFIGPNYLVTVHDGHSRSIADLAMAAERNPAVLGEGAVSLFHRIVDAMIDRYRPEVERIEDTLDELERTVFDKPSQTLLRRILDEKRNVSLLRRVIAPQRDVIGRLARREFIDVGTDMAFRFRDVYDALVRLADDTTMFQDRITGILDAHLTSVSNRLNQVMQVLTVLATIFMPLTLLAGLWGMNVVLPRFPGGEAAQFAWLCGMMGGVAVLMLVWFRLRRWL